jgi:hypothetical protein
MNPLLFAAKENSTILISLAIRMGLDINSKEEEYGMTALMFAVEHGNIEMIHILLKNGANINLENNFYMTALVHAARDNKQEIIRILLDNGATLETHHKCSIYPIRPNETIADHRRWVRENFLEEDWKKLINEEIRFSEIRKSWMSAVIKAGIRRYSNPLATVIDSTPLRSKSRFQDFTSAIYSGISSVSSFLAMLPATGRPVIENATHEKNNKRVIIVQDYPHLPPALPLSASGAGAGIGAGAYSAAGRERD